VPPLEARAFLFLLQIASNSGRAHTGVIPQRVRSAMSKQKLVWKKKPEAEDYKGALSFLQLIYADAKARRLLQLFRKAKTIEHAAKDLLRAANLPLLPLEEPHVEADLTRISKGKDLPPVLLVRGDMTQGVPLVVADGYHRICAICYYDESAPIPCRLVSA
jgi:hypothetical protein